MTCKHIIKNCAFCGREFDSLIVRERIFCSRECDSRFKKGRSIGKYNSDRVDAVVEGKRKSYLNKVLQNLKNGKYDLERIKFILENVPIKTERQLNRLLKKDSSKDRSFDKELKYLLEYLDLNKFLKKEKYPECYTCIQPEGMIWIKSILEKCENYADFKLKFKEEYNNYKKYNVRLTCSFYKNILLYVQYSGIKTKALKENFTKNLSGLGTSIEIKTRNILESLECEFKEHVYLKDFDLNKQYIPDFIINDKIIIEVNGDFWHAFNITPDKMKPRQRENIIRDIMKYNFYEKMGYKYLVIWEHEFVNIDSIKNKIKEVIFNERDYKTIIY